MKRLRFALGVALAGALLLAALPAGAPAATRPSVSLKPATPGLIAGAALLLTGTVGHARAGATSVVILTEAGTQWRRLATVKLSAKHSFAVTVTLTKAGRRHLIAQYKAGRLTARSKVVAVTVRAAAGDWATVSASYVQTLAIKTDGSLWAFGGNGNGQLGLGDTRDRLVPIQVSSARDWVAVSCGARHTMALKKDGTLWAWGGNEEGELGLGDHIERHTPAEVGHATDWAAVSCGENHTMALKTDGSLWAWGDNSYAQLGTGDYDEKVTPTQVGSTSDWAAIMCGDIHTLALKEDGSLWAWGDNTYGELGLGASADLYVPAPTKVGSAADWAATSCGFNYTLALRDDGTLWAWGANDRGQLGLGSSDDTPHPTPTEVGSTSNWATVSCGNDQTLALKGDGTAWAWGSSNDKEVPTQVGGARDWATVCCGYWHTLAIKRDATLWAWGNNGEGELGLGDTSGRNNPTEVGKGSR